MDEDALSHRLCAEGFAHTFVWQDGPNAHYPNHTHASETTHLILEGEMALSMNGATHTFGPGERCDVPAGTVHSARMGPNGCRYLIGER
jgi:mannose-6-phosphate isomerase-like protein (cupin superfamily)